MRKIKITFHGQTAEATMLEKEAPKTCSAIWNKLPIEGDLHHAKCTGEEVIFIVPFLLSSEKGGEFIERGSISYFPPTQSIMIYYWSHPVRTMESTVFAKITGSLEEFIEEIKKVHQKQGDKIVFQRAS